MTTDERISRLEGAYEQVDQRRGDLTQAVSSLRQEVMGRLDALHSETTAQIGALHSETAAQIGALRSELNSRFNTLLVVGAGAWVTTVGLIVGLYLQS